MKDYTKYDFAAIVGAEVEVNIRFFPRHKGKVLCRWEYEGKPYLTILVCEPNGSHLCDIPVDEITSISARIKVEDMSLKQIKKLVEDDGFDTLLFDKLGFAEREYLGNNKLSLSCFIKSYDDYIDCTEWGWKK